jgi:hypothetical protein
MKFHQALAGLTLLFPIATVGKDLQCQYGNGEGGVDALCVQNCGDVKGQDFNCKTVCEYFGIPYEKPNQCKNAASVSTSSPTSWGNNYCNENFTNPPQSRNSCCICEPAEPTDIPCQTVGCNGDPHFKTWRGQHFDYHGECDLVLLKSDKFEAGLGLDIHIRTKIRRHMSYISSAALRIGSEVLEVESQGVYWWKGVLNADLPAEF